MERMEAEMRDDGLNSQDKRNAEIAAALKTEPARAIARRYHLSPSRVYRIAKERKNGGEHFAQPNGQGNGTRSHVGGGLFSEIGQPGLRRFGGESDEDYDRAFKPLRRKLAVYGEMSNDPVVSAVLQSI